LYVRGGSTQKIGHFSPWGIMNRMSRILLAALVAVSSLALAAAPKRAAAIGSSKEDEPCPALVGSSGPDLAFLRAVSWAFEPAPQEIRTQAIEDLGLLGDARSLNHLAALTLDANAAVSRAAIRAIGTIRHPRAEEILENLVRHPSAPLATKQNALNLLPFQNTATALRFVHATARQTTAAYEIAQLARSLSSTLPVPALDPVAPPPQVAPADAAVAPSPFPGDSK
jgi:HEAT repeat protein